MKKNSLLRNGWIPLQHGAWPMTFVPVLLGTIIGGPAWIHLLLLVSWTVAFLFFNVFGLWVKARRKSRYLPATLTYGIVAALGATALLILRPSLWVWGIPLAICFAWATIEVLRRNEHSLPARLSAILASALMTPIAFSLGSHPNDWHRIWICTAIVALYFAGTVPYVKTLIRKRGDRAWWIGSLSFHAVVVVTTLVAAAYQQVTWLIPAVWVLLLVRAWAYPFWSARRPKPLSPKAIGISEFVFCAMVIASVLWQ